MISYQQGFLFIFMRGSFQKATICVLLLIFNFTISFTQSSRNLYLGIGLSGHSYVGDLTEPNLKLQRFQPGGHISLLFANSRRLRPQINIGLGSIIEQLDEGNLEISSIDVSPNTFVETSIFHTEFQLNVHVLKQGFFQPYFAGGAGIVFYQPKDEHGNALGDNPFTREEGEIYSTAGFYLPLTAGFILKLGSKLSLSASYTFRPTTTDYLDNISFLGKRAGNDRLHSFQISIFFNLRKTRPSIHIPPESQPELRPIIVAQTEQDGHSLHIMNLVEPDWIAWEETALLQRKFLYYPVRKGDQLSDLCKRFHLRSEVVRRINFMNNDHLDEGIVLRLPDVGQKIDTN